LERAHGNPPPQAAKPVTTRINAARSLVAAVKQLRRGELKPPDAGLREPRQK
jgi:hypothetical protein